MKKNGLLTGKVLLLCILTALIASTPTRAVTIFWGSSVNDLLFDSSGNPLDDSFTFEIGTFGSSFNPEDANKELWLANWKILDRVTAPASSGWDSATQFFSSSFVLLPDGTSSRGTEIGTNFVFSAGEQAFIWVFNSQTLDVDTEWALVTNGPTDGSTANDWIIPPLPDTCGCTSGSNSLEWRLSTSHQPDFGGVNDLYGPGNVTDTPPSYTLQTATLPEPGSSLLILAAGLLFRLRRRRY
jgi:hypothetical protein